MNSLANSIVGKFLLAFARLIFAFAANVAMMIPALNSKYKIRERLRGPWIAEGTQREASVPQKHLWLHGASLGECKMLLSLAKALKNDWPECPAILLTTQKAESVESLRRAAQGVCRVSVAPADFSSSLKMFKRLVNPVALILGENELWPGYLREMKDDAGRSAVALVSGRVYRMAPGVSLSSLGFLAMQKDGGNWKLLQWARSNSSVKSSVNPSIGVAFISFHKEEMQSFCELVSAAISAEKSVVLAPRRLEEIEEFRKVLNRFQIRNCSWPEIRKSSVSIVEQFGVVSDILNDCSAVVVGGSFVKKPGIHDFWEPLCAGVQTYVGPFAGGAEESVDALVRSNALIRVCSPIVGDRIFCDAPANGVAIKNALLAEREKILNSYAQLLHFLKDRLQ